MNQLARCALLVIVLGGGSILTVAWAQTPEAREPKKEPAQAAAGDTPEAQPGPGDVRVQPS